MTCYFRLLRYCISCTFLLCFISEKSNAQSIPLANAYAHNDYWHKRPLLDALENGYTNIEVDIFWVGDEFVVAHLFPFFRSGKTLENIYLKPLYEHIYQNKGKVYANYHQPITLMVDIKMNGNSTYQALKKLLAKYRSILTSYENGVLVPRQVTIVLSGSKPYESLRKENNRLAFIDEDLKAIARNNNPSSTCPIASCHYGSMLSWNGTGPMPTSQRNKLRSYVDLAHQQGKKVRLWASPEKENVWQELLHCGVDLINTDQLVLLKQFLLTRYQPLKMLPITANHATPTVFPDGK